MDTATVLAAVSVVGICAASFILGMLFYRFMHRRIKRRYDRLHCVSTGHIY